MTLKSRRGETTPSTKKTGEPQNEFLNLKLRQTSQDGRGRKGEAEPKVDFGVKLKTTVSVARVCVHRSHQLHAKLYYSTLYGVHTCVAEGQIDTILTCSISNYLPK